MIHIMSPVQSTRSPNTFYTAQGLGDRVHLVTVAWCISNAMNQPVHLHLHKMQSSERKKNSFNEILQLFPDGHIELVFHEYEPKNDSEFERFLRDNCGEIIRIFYGDYLGWNEKTIGIDVSLFLSRIPLLSFPSGKSRSEEIANRKRYITSQWDTTGEKRRFKQHEVKKILNAYRLEGYEVITVGGEASEGKYRESLLQIAELIAGAEFHVGVDSGFMHFAQLFLPTSRIHVYSKSGNFWSHHLFRGLDNGMKLNVYFKKISRISLFFIRLRYDSPGLAKVVHNLHNRTRSRLGR